MVSSHRPLTALPASSTSTAASQARTATQRVIAAQAYALLRPSAMRPLDQQGAREVATFLSQVDPHQQGEATSDALLATFRDSPLEGLVEYDLRHLLACLPADRRRTSLVHLYACCRRGFIDGHAFSSQKTRPGDVISALARPAGLAPNRLACTARAQVGSYTTRAGMLGIEILTYPVRPVGVPGFEGLLGAEALARNARRLALVSRVLYRLYPQVAAMVITSSGDSADRTAERHAS